MDTGALIAFLRKASEDEGLRRELVALAGRHGIELGSDELSEEALEQVSGGLLPAAPTLGMSTLQSKLGGISSSGEHIKKATRPADIGSLGDGSV